MHFITAMISRETEGAHIGRRQMMSILFVPPALAVGIFILHSISRRLYLRLLAEWMPVEILQVVFFSLAGLLAFRIAIHLWANHDRALATFYLLACLGLFFISGEELSWGQPVFRRLFPWWPDRDALRDINTQGETTIHNLRSVQWLFNWFYLLLAVYGSISPALFSIQRWHDNPRLRLLAMPVITLPAFLVMTGFMIIRLFVAPYTGLTDSQSFMRYKEVGELTLAFGLWVFTWMNWRRLSHPSVQDVAERVDTSADALSSRSTTSK
jgi:hypothetical protein